MKNIIEDLRERIENMRRELFKWCNEEPEDMASITAIIDKHLLNEVEELEDERRNKY